MAWSTKFLTTSLLGLCLLFGAQDAHSQPPTVTDVSIPEPSNGFAFELAEAINVIVDFDRAVAITGVPQLALTIDAQTRYAAFIDTPAGPEDSVYFRYTVVPSDYDADGLGIAADALTLGGGTITALDGTAALLDLGSHAMSDYLYRQVDGRRETTPVVGGVTISPPPFGDTFELDETITVSVWFNRAVTVTGVPQLALRMETQTRYASFSGAPAPSRIAPEAPAFAPWPLRFLYAVGSSDLDTDGISIAADALVLNDGAIRIRGGTAPAALDLARHAILDSAGHKVDGERPGGRTGGNRAPRVVEELPDIEIDVDETLTVDAAPAFEDPDGDSLRYSAWSAHTNVTVTTSGSTVRLLGIRPGVATVHVAATDPAGLSADTTFRVAVGALLWAPGGRPAAPEGGTVVLALELSKPLTYPVSTRWHVTPDSLAATDDADAADYLAEPAGRISIPAGETHATIEIPIADDEDIEPAREHFVVHLDPLAERNVALARTLGTQAVIQEGVCDRTPIIRDELSPHVAGCHWPNSTALDAVTTLDLSRRKLDVLRPNDLLGLRGLRRLDLSGNALEALPVGLFAGLGRLQEVSVEGNPGAPFALTVELRRLDAAPLAPGPARVAAETAWGAPFLLLATLRAAPEAATGELPAEVEIAPGATMGEPFVAASNNGGALVLRAEAASLPMDECEGQPCFRGFQTLPGPALTLFRPAPRALAAPTPEPLLGGDALRLPLASLVEAADPPEELRWEATSSNPALATVRIVDGALEVTPELASAGVAEIGVIVTNAVGLTATVRFEVRVEFHWPRRSWRATLTRIQQPDGN